MIAFLDDAYGTRLRLSRSAAPRPGQPALVHTRVDVGGFVIDEVAMCGEVTVSPDPLNKVMALWPSNGRVEGKCDGIGAGARAGEVAMMAQPDLPYDAHAEDLVVTTVLLDPALVATVAGGNPAVPVRFSSFEPVDAAAGRHWRETVSFIKDSVLAEGAPATPLVVGQASRLLAAVTLATFPNDLAEKEPAAERTDAQPAVLRRAIQFIESHADSDIALADIAEAVHISPRAVQYMFRRHLGTTPLQYLRRLRLRAAHHELIEADRSHDTVSQIAAKWGFAHTGRFAVLYRETYGRSPHTTLRN